MVGPDPTRTPAADAIPALKARRDQIDAERDALVGSLPSVGLARRRRRLESLLKRTGRVVQYRRAHVQEIRRGPDERPAEGGRAMLTIGDRTYRSRTRYASASLNWTAEHENEQFPDAAKREWNSLAGHRGAPKPARRLIRELGMRQSRDPLSQRRELRARPPRHDGPHIGAARDTGTACGRAHARPPVGRGRRQADRPGRARPLRRRRPLPRGGLSARIRARLLAPPDQPRVGPVRDGAPGGRGDARRRRGRSRTRLDRRRGHHPDAGDHRPDHQSHLGRCARPAPPIGDGDADHDV